MTDILRILTKRKFRFRFDGQQFISKGQNLIEEAPDWIAKDGLYDLALKCGELAVLDRAPVVQGSSATEEPAEPKPEPKKAPVKKAPAKKTAARKK